jgi:hypothetical protein
MAARKVPDTWIPAATGRTVAEQYLASVDEETGNDVVDADGPVPNH